MAAFKKSEVKFYEEPHIYDLNGKHLQGVTTIVKWLFPDTYANIPQGTMEQARKRGDLIHHQCQAFDELGVGVDITEVMWYRNLCTVYDLCHLESEYLVDDGAEIASKIDKIYKGGNDAEVILGDIKCTSQIHYEHVSLQLSIYAALFEAMNPGIKVGKLVVVWLPKPQYGDPAVVSVGRIDAEACRDIMQGFINGEDSAQYREKYFGGHNAKEVANVEERLPMEFKDAEERIIELSNILNDAKVEYDKLREGMLALMEQHGVKKWCSDRLEMTRKLPTTRESVDSTKLKKKYPEVYAECLKVSDVKGSITIKVL